MDVKVRARSLADHQAGFQAANGFGEDGFELPSDVEEVPENNTDRIEKAVKFAKWLAASKHRPKFPDPRRAGKLEMVTGCRMAVSMLIDLNTDVEKWVSKNHVGSRIAKRTLTMIYCNMFTNMRVGRIMAKSTWLKELIQNQDFIEAALIINPDSGYVHEPQAVSAK